MLVFFVILAFTSACLCGTSCSKPVCGENEISVDCRILCPPKFCNISYTDYACDPNPKCEPGCDCIKDYLRDYSGRCVFNENCPPPPSLPDCGEFEEPSECGILYSQPHDPAIDLYSKCRRCKCIDKYVRDSYGACVPIPPAIACGQNEEASTCKKVCPPQSCDWDPKKYACKAGPCQAGCNCVYGHLRDENGNCIPKEQCSRSKPVCGENEISVDCRILCPPQSCNNSYTEYACDPNPKCEPGCDCIKDYLRDYSGRCVFNENCPPPPSLPDCGEFEEPSECGILYSQPHDPAIDLYSKCRRCKCIDKYVRDSYGACVPIPPTIACGQNEEASTCKKVCPPQSCDWDPKKYACKAGPCQAGCNCVYGHLRDENGNCIPKEQCSQIPDEDYELDDVLILINVPPKYRIPNGGSSKTIITTIPCKTGETPCIYDRCTPTCSIPNPPNCPQLSTGKTNRCNCSDGYILSEKGGQCITIQECQSRNTCRQNETFVYCNVGCPTNNCPENDNRATVACDPPYPCPPGCACKPYYKRISYTDDRCILASDCPPVKCTRQYEVWNSCPPPCFSDKCPDLKQTPQECYRNGLDCQPQCVCQENYCRNASEICVPVPDLSETPCIYDRCTPTCSIPNPPNCPQISTGKTNRCNCSDGYILSEKGGQCITIQECQSRNTCRQNETFVYCTFGCPSNNCPENDNRATVACGVPFNCPPGCACKPYYKRISYTDDRCVLASDCPPVKCTRQYEVWNSCPSPCFSDKCRDLKQTPQECFRFGLECQPQCVCQENYCRNDTEICIPVSDFTAE